MQFALHEVLQSNMEAKQKTCCILTGVKETRKDGLFRWTLHANSPTIFKPQYFHSAIKIIDIIQNAAKNAQTENVEWNTLQIILNQQECLSLAIEILKNDSDGLLFLNQRGM